MTSSVDYARQATVWAGETKTKWQGLFGVRWAYVKDVPNGHLRHILNEWNENKPVTNSRDTQEMPPAVGQQVLMAIHAYAYKTCLFDDFDHYDDVQKEECDEKNVRVGCDLLIYYYRLPNRPRVDLEMGHNTTRTLPIQDPDQPTPPSCDTDQLIVTNANSTSKQLCDLNT
jgi:hypothetical protein